MAAYRTSGHLTLADIWGIDLWHLGQCLPQVFCLLLSPSSLTSFSLQTLSKMCDYDFFSKTLVGGMKTISLSGGVIVFASWSDSKWLKWPSQNFLPLLCQGHGGCQKFCSDLAYLLVLPEKATNGEMMFRLAVVQVQPYQTYIPTLDEVMRKLALLTASHENWAYTFVRFNEDAQHAPLPKEGHLSAMFEGTSSRSTCRCLCQLEVHLVLQSGCQVVYPEGLNGVLELVVTSFTESLAHRMNILDESTFLLVDLSEASALHNTLVPISPTHLAAKLPSRVGSRISMTAEVQELSFRSSTGHFRSSFRSLSLKRPASAALGAAPPSKVEDSSKAN